MSSRLADRTQSWQLTKLGQAPFFRVGVVSSLTSKVDSAFETEANNWTLGFLSISKGSRPSRLDVSVVTLTRRIDSRYYEHYNLPVVGDVGGGEKTDRQAEQEKQSKKQIQANECRD